jgi:hypothetical protein
MMHRFAMTRIYRCKPLRNQGLVSFLDWICETVRQVAALDFAALLHRFLQRLFSPDHSRRP